MAHSGPRLYVAVFAALVVLTIATVAISYVDLGALSTMVALAIAFGKALLVLLFFMHLYRGGKVTWMVIVVTLFWVGILFALTLSDFLTRGSVPHMPGH